MATLVEIEQATLAFSTERHKLADIVNELEAEMNAAKQKRMKAIRSAVESASEKRSILFNLLKGAKDLFISPRTAIFHGIKVGYNKGKGKVDWQDDDQVAKLVKKNLPDKFDELVETRYVPIADALSRLDASQLRKLGVNIVDADDQVVIKPTDGAVDKIVNALLKDASKQD